MAHTCIHCVVCHSIFPWWKDLVDVSQIMLCSWEQDTWVQLLYVATRSIACKDCDLGPKTDKGSPLCLWVPYQLKEDFSSFCFGTRNTPKECRLLAAWGTAEEIIVKNANRKWIEHIRHSRPLLSSPLLSSLFPPLDCLPSPLPFQRRQEEWSSGYGCTANCCSSWMIS